MSIQQVGEQDVVAISACAQKERNTTAIVVLLNINTPWFRQDVVHGHLQRTEEISHEKLEQRRDEK